MTLAGRRIVLTGAASGIGRASARAFVAAGARVALLDVQPGPLAALAAELGMPGFACDVSDPDQVDDAATRAEAALGGVDGLVNAAGISRRATLETITAASWQRTLGVNLFGPFLLCQRLAPALRAAGSATIVNIASIGALRPASGVSAYAASKAGLIAFSKCMAVELSPHVRVNAICPGIVATPMTQDLLADEPTRTRLVEGNMTGRLGRPEDIADAILYLSGPGSAFVNGATLVVDGGYTWL